LEDAVLSGAFREVEFKKEKQGIRLKREIIPMGDT
jgi:hypothetical protein